MPHNLAFELNPHFVQGKAGEAELDSFFRAMGWAVKETTPAQERLQCLGDRVFSRGGATFYVEYKTDAAVCKTGNVFFETVSVDTTKRPGWVYTCKSDYIFYASLELRTILVFAPAVLRKNIESLSNRFRVTETGKHNSGYKTHGVLVPFTYARDVLALSVIDMSSKQDVGLIAIRSEGHMNANAFECWTTGYLPTGRKVSFTLSAETPAALIALALDFDRQLITAGIQTTEPGLDEGEFSETVGAMVKRMKGNQDGTQTPVIDIYLENDALKWAFLKVYLNTAEDIEAFTLATGYTLNDLPEYESGTAIERGKNAALDAKYIRKPRKPARFVWQNNPRYEEESMKPKKLFVRWMTGDTPVAPQANGHSEAHSEPDSKYNVEMLKSVLAQAGYTQANSAYFLENLEPGKPLARFSDSSLPEAALHKRILTIGKELQTTF